MSKFVKSSGKKIPVYCVVVQDARVLSDEISRKTGVRHQSPQALLIHNKECVWNASHGAVNEFKLQEAVAKQ